MPVSFRRPLVTWVLAALGCTAVGTAALLTVGVTGPGQTPNGVRWPWLELWVRWDAGWYQGIADRGYEFSATAQSSVAYFPLYALSVKALAALGLDTFVAGIVATWLFGAAAFVVFFAWARQVAGDGIARRALVVLAVWPFAFFLYGAIYSDALFLLLVCGAFLALEKDRLALAIALGALATATRPLAPAVVLGLLARHLERRRGQPFGIASLAPLLSGAGLAAYMGYLWWRFGDPVAFATTQVGWGQLSGPASFLKYGALSELQGSQLVLPAFHAALAVGFLWLAWRTRRSLGWGYAVYAAAAVGIPLVTSRDFIGLGRYCLAAAPCFLELARLTSPRPRAWLVWTVASALLLAWMTMRFATGRYIS